MNYLVKGYRSLWVNSRGLIVGYFSYNGFNIHPPFPILDNIKFAKIVICKTTKSDWEYFKEEMLSLHGVDLSNEPTPNWLD